MYTSLIVCRRFKAQAKRGKPIQRGASTYDYHVVKEELSPLRVMVPPWLRPSRSSTASPILNHIDKHQEDIKQESEEESANLSTVPIDPTSQHYPEYPASQARLLSPTSSTSPALPAIPNTLAHMASNETQAGTKAKSRDASALTIAVKGSSLRKLNQPGEGPTMSGKEGRKGQSVATSQPNSYPANTSSTPRALRGFKANTGRGGVPIVRATSRSPPLPRGISREVLRLFQYYC